MLGTELSANQLVERAELIQQQIMGSTLGVSPGVLWSTWTEFLVDITKEMCSLRVDINTLSESK